MNVVVNGRMRIVLSLVCLVVVSLALGPVPLASGPTLPGGRLGASVCTYTAAAGDTIVVRVDGVVIPCFRVGTRGNLTVYPTDLTMSPANHTGGTFPGSVLADDDDRLSLAETCWKWSPTNNTTYCDGQYAFRWWFEWNGQVPPWTTATASMRVLQTGDAEPMRVLIRTWPSWTWATINIPPFPSQETLYEFTLTAGQWSSYFGSVWSGIEDRFPTDTARTTISIDEISVRLTF